MKVLVTGGAGYIGSHMIAELMENGHEPIAFDNLSTGNRKAVMCDGFYLGDIRNPLDLDRVFNENKFDAVIHFAASSLVGESMGNPLKYYNNNVHGTATLLEAMGRHGVRNIVFSSTAAVYGEADEVPISEKTPVNPKSPYGETKLAIEKMIAWASCAMGINYISLRYFNACGAHKSGKIGEWRENETHLIPIILQNVLGLRKDFRVFGNDYDTPDGTCIRDYIHVMDLVRAHTAAMMYLHEGGKSDIFNLGIGKGFSVLQIVRAAEEATGRKVEYTIEGRRAGDPAVLVASNDKAREILSWKAVEDDPVEIIKDAWNFYTRHPGGY
jgi:UDP-glucose 4-epimerase